MDGPTTPAQVYGEPCFFDLTVDYPKDAMPPYVKLNSLLPYRTSFQYSDFELGCKLFFSLAAISNR